MSEHETADNLYFISLYSADGLVREYQCEENYRPLKIQTAIAPGVSRTYEFKDEGRMPLVMIHRIGNRILGQYDYPMVRYYEEKIPKLKAWEREVS